MFAAPFLIGWLLFSNALLLNLFIALILESFSISEKERKDHQAKVNEFYTFMINICCF